MKKLISCMLVALLSSGGAFAQGAKEVSDARAATESFMKLMDAEEYSAAWNASAESVRNETSKMAWNLLSTAVHLPLGTAKGHSYKSASVKPGTITFEYVGNYENSHNVQESVTTVRDKDGVWRVSGYGIHADTK
jgi:outer membrane lipoprotein-sorting protein